ncbi:GLABROUS1 enhancer-binding protein family [Arabidopsis suecica]|uniref:GLABROUS1 enhancer-binding protein family n=1 Tax=Arabidopsis suecica TaxID=45249 RepID=A0A8T2BKZ0_ARASU|nr:GLABROUS1 enhancer-binding protein family [Arabidopsis suecica]
MAKKLLNPLEDPPTASSSDDDEVEISSEEDEEQISNSEDPATIPSTKTLKSPSAAAPSPNSGSETDSDSEKPHVFTKKKEATDSPAVKSVKKRASEGTTSKDKNVKKAKKVSGDDDNKKPRFQRLWTEEDEISLLQGMIDFKAETGTSPYDDMNGFFDVAKKNISFDVSKNQFGDKIRGLKKKYFGSRKKKSVESDHDKKCLELAKSIWGLGVVESPVKSKKKKDESVVKGKSKEKKDESVVKANGKEKKLESLVEEDKEVAILGGDSESSNWFDKSFLVRVVASLGVDECIVKWKWSKVSVETKKKIEEKMKFVESKEFELLSQKVDILKEVTTVIAETI